MAFCGAFFVRQTDENVKTKITEHWNDIPKSTGNHAVTTEHYNHNFDWNVDVLDSKLFLF